MSAGCPGSVVCTLAEGEKRYRHLSSALEDSGASFQRTIIILVKSNILKIYYVLIPIFAAFKLTSPIAVLYLLDPPLS